MRRREFVSLLGGAAAGLPLGVRAQQQKLPTIGVMGTDSRMQQPWMTAFAQHMGELGWIDKRTVAIEYRFSEGHPTRDLEIAAEFVHLKVDIIVTGGPAVAIAKRAAADTSIVFALASDPVGGGLVESLSHPGGNLTGLSLQQTDTSGKRLELLREMVPGLRRVEIIANANFPQAMLERKDVEAAARALGLDVTKIEVLRPDDIATAFAAGDTQPGALYVVGDRLLNSLSQDITARALGARLPTVFNNRSFVQDGGLMSYGPDFTDLWRRAADYVDKILRGAKPADLPVEQPTKFELVINAKTAKSLGLSIPPMLLALANEMLD